MIIVYLVKKLLYPLLLVFLSFNVTLWFLFVLDKYLCSHNRINWDNKKDKIKTIKATYNIESDNYHTVRFPKKINKRIRELKKQDISSVFIENENESENENEYDTIIIGSGIGSLTTAALLAKSGKRVMVLEQHSIAGGTTHSFIDHGVEHEVGLHYIGNIHKLGKVFNIIAGKKEGWWWNCDGIAPCCTVCRSGNIEWKQIGHENPDGKMIYDEIHIGDKSYYFEAGRDNLAKYLKSKFPNDADAIDSYFILIEKAAKKNLFFMLKVFPWKWISYFIRYIDPDYHTFVSMSVTDVLSGLTTNKELISVLSGQYGDYGILPSKASFFFHAAVVNHYLNGGWFPRGGTSIIAKNICKTIFHNGGCVFVNCSVERIVTKKINDRMGRSKYVVSGVELKNGDIINANEVVSGVGIRNTFNTLLTTKVSLSPARSLNVPLYSLPLEQRPDGIDVYKKIMDNIKPSVQHIYCFVKMRGEPASLGLRSANLWIYPHGDYDKIEKEFLENPLESPMPMFMAFSCVKDDKWNETYPGFSNAIILTLAKKEWFDEWKDERCTKRGDVYNDYKDRIGERMLEEGLYKFFPKTRGSVEHFEMATPLTTQHYLRSAHGESYGLDINRHRLLNAADLRPKTSIGGLYLTGQDICTLGVSGALSSGVMTASVIMGYDNMFDIALGNNIIDDLSVVDKRNKIKKNE